MSVVAGGFEVTSAEVIGGVAAVAGTVVTGEFETVPRYES